MATHAIEVHWTRDHQFIGSDEGGHGVIMDAPDKGKAEGTSPLELVLYALAGCTAIDVVNILKKKRQPLNGLDVDVKGVQADGPFAHPYVNVELRYVIDGTDVAPKAIEDAIKLSLEKYCSVHAMLSPKIIVTTSWVYAQDKK